MAGKTNIRKKYVFLILLSLSVTGLFVDPTWAFWQNRITPLVVLDPGHGGSSAGVRGLNGILEKDLVLHLAHSIAKELEGCCNTFLTREGDFNPDAERRAEMANNNKATLFISLHTGGGFSQASGPLRIFHVTPPPSSRIPAQETWQEGQSPHIPQSVQLAEDLAESMREVFLSGSKKVLIQHAKLSILGPLDMPAVLLELGHLSAPQDALWLSDSATQKGLARAIAHGICAYLETDF